MKIAKNIAELQLALKALPDDLALIPTMGALHDGHLSLVELAQSQAKATAVSIFVNPSQFNNSDDLKQYPRTIDVDLEKLEKAGVDLVFTPDASEIYPKDFQTNISVSKLSQTMEGEFRPGHFEGVATIVTILLNLFQPKKIIFGEKDFQQLCLIKKLVGDLKIPTAIIPAPIYREESGLAMSSRNTLLSRNDRITASHIYQGLCLAHSQVQAGVVDCEEIIGKCMEFFNDEEDITVEYLRIVDSEKLEGQKEIHNHSRIFFAGFVAGVRLIDNIQLV